MISSPSGVWCATSRRPSTQEHDVVAGVALLPQDGARARATPRGRAGRGRANDPGRLCTKRLGPSSFGCRSRSAHDNAGRNRLREPGARRGRSTRSIARRQTAQNSVSRVNMMQSACGAVVALRLVHRALEGADRCRRAGPAASSASTFCLLLAEERLHLLLGPLLARGSSRRRAWISFCARLERLLGPGRRQRRARRSTRSFHLRRGRAAPSRSAPRARRARPRLP